MLTTPKPADGRAGWPAAAKTRYLSPVRTFIVLSVSLFLAELAVMYVLPFLPLAGKWVVNLLDATLMVLLSFPVLYYLVLRPLRLLFQERQRVEAELRLHQEDLEKEMEVRRQAELARERLREELARVTRVATAGQLVASLAHELGQPLAAILFNVEAAEHLLASGQADFKEVRATLSDMQADSQRAADVIERLRSWCRKTEPQQTVFPFNEIIQQASDLLRSEFVLKSISAQILLEPTLGKVLGNRVELQQAVLNLIMNAVEAMTALEPGLRRLNISTYQDGADAVCAICDSGPGLPEAVRSRLFEPFFTTKPNGMGMGLVISQSIIQNHGGKLWTTNNPDRGATFCLSLPLKNSTH